VFLTPFWIVGALGENEEVGNGWEQVSSKPGAMMTVWIVG